MKTSPQDTLSLLKQLKHKRFNSEMPSLHNNTHQPLVSPSSSGHGFVCPYHPTQFVTNICVSPQFPSAKPLCPRCLTQHINSHQLSSSPTSCKLEPCDVEVQSISYSLTQKLSSCHKLKQTVSNLNKWQSVQLQEIQLNLSNFKASLLNQIEKEFSSLQKEIQSKWQSHTKEYNETVKKLEENMGNLEEHCQRSLKLIGQRKEIDSICSSVSEINKKYEGLVNVEEKVLNLASLRIQGKFTSAKISEIVGSVKNSLELKTSKVSGFEIDRILKQVCLKSARLQEQVENTTLSKLQKLFQTNNSTKKLHNLSDNEIEKDKLSYNKMTECTTQKEWTENTHDRVLVRLNDTTNKLKESLNTFSKSNKFKFHT